MLAIRMHRTGAAEVLMPEEVNLPQPGAGEARVKLAASGVNFIDIYHRTGLYSVPLPYIPGQEGAGVVDAVGEGVTGLRPGERVAWAMQPGGYAEYALIPAWKLVPLPEGQAFDTAAALLLQGMTAHYLSHDTFPLQSGSRALVHAAAGGTGQLLVQIARLRGARVLALTSTAAKAEVARRCGAEEVLLSGDPEWPQRARAWSGGTGVDVVYDSVGQATFGGSLAALKTRGLLVLFGQASGPVPPFDPARLAGGGSLYLTRPILAHYAGSAAEIRRRCSDLFAWMAAGRLQVTITRTFPLAEAAAAQEFLTSRQALGKVLLVP
ncbi:MAG TPA: quinone oxidoreductase [bacterium]|nr:quinone oxidoreductase [bacterium]HPR86762.1 quinone oxidoreductase [bacterium]